MPKSKVRDKVKKKQKIAPVIEQMAAEDDKLESPSWLAPVMVANFILGLIWIVIFYISGTNYPIPGIGAWNMLVGFGFVGIGFSLATRWYWLARLNECCRFHSKLSSSWKWNFISDTEFISQSIRANYFP